jgi:hypothetical protein
VPITLARGDGATWGSGPDPVRGPANTENQDRFPRARTALPLVSVALEETIEELGPILAGWH